MKLKFFYYYYFSVKRKPPRISAFIGFFPSNVRTNSGCTVFAIYIKLNKMYDWKIRRYRACCNQNTYDNSCIFNGLSFDRYKYEISMFLDTNRNEFFKKRVFSYETAIVHSKPQDCFLWFRYNCNHRSRSNLIICWMTGWGGSTAPDAVATAAWMTPSSLFSFLLEEFLWHPCFSKEQHALIPPL